MKYRSPIPSIACVCAIVLLSCQSGEPTDQSFGSAAEQISFRYPGAWIEKQAQLHSTIVLLYATDGSEATCNINSGKSNELEKLSEKQLEEYRVANHTRKYYQSLLENSFEKLIIVNYWRGHLGQKSAGYVEYTYNLNLNKEKVPVTAYAGATFANARRYVLSCNAPTPNKNTAKNAFDKIRSSIIFMF